LIEDDGGESLRLAGNGRNGGCPVYNGDWLPAEPPDDHAQEVTNIWCIVGNQDERKIGG
jgi:hypothetical protein